MSSDTWFWVVNVLNNYWFLVTLNSLLLLTLFISAGFFSWISKFIRSIFIWSFLWASIAFIHNNNPFLSGSLPWEINNYLINSLWQIIQIIWHALPMLWDESSLIYEILSWQWLEALDTNDLKHLMATLLITLLWVSKKSKNSEKLPQKKIDSVAPSLPNSFGSVSATNLNRSAYNGPIDFRALVDAWSVRSLADNIIINYPEGNSADLLRAAAIFEYVKNNVTYLSDDIQYGGDYVASPQQTLKTKKGDCDDQAVLMASLFAAANIKYRMLKLGNVHDEYHLVTEFCIEVRMKNKFAEKLNKFYENCDRSFDLNGYYFFEEQDGIWLLADTTRNHVADFESLIADGFLHKTDSEIKWHNIEGVY